MRFAALLLVLLPTLVRAEILRTPDGFLLPVREAGQQIVHVDSSAEEGGNGSLSAPYRTLRDGYDALEDGSASWLALEERSTFPEGFPQWRKSGESAEDRLWVTSYRRGEPPVYHTTRRPVILASRAIEIFKDGVGDLAFHNLNIHDRSRDPSSSLYDPHDAGSAIFVAARGAHDLLFQSLKIQYTGGGITLSGQSGDPIRSPWVRRCWIGWTYSGEKAQGIYAQSTVDLLVEDTWVYHAGWASDLVPSPPDSSPTIYSHGLYLQANQDPPTCRGLLVAMPASHGLQLRPGGLCEGSVFSDCSIGLTLGNYKNTGPAVHSVLRDSAILWAKDISGDLPRGTGIASSEGSALVERTLFCFDRAEGNKGAIEFSDEGHERQEFEGVLVYDWGRAIAVGDKEVPATYRSSSFYAAEELVFTKSPRYATMRFEGNRWYSSLSRPFETQRRSQSFGEFQGETGATGSFTPSAPSYPDPKRDISTYYHERILGLPVDKARTFGSGELLEEFFDQASRQVPGDFDARYLAPALLGYLRAGFGDTPEPPDPPDPPDPPEPPDPPAEIEIELEVEGVTYSGTIQRQE